MKAPLSTLGAHARFGPVLERSASLRRTPEVNLIVLKQRVLMEKRQNRHYTLCVCVLCFLGRAPRPKASISDLNNEPRSLFRRRGTVNLWLREYADGAREKIVFLARPGEHERYFIPEQK